MDGIIPNHKLLCRTELDTKKKLTPFSEKSRPSVKKTYPAKRTLQKSKQIRCLKTKTTTKLHSNIEIFILQTYL